MIANSAFRHWLIPSLVFGLVGWTAEVRAQHDHPAIDLHDHDPPRTRYEFGGFSHTDELALSLERQASALCWTLHRHYRQNPDYRTVYRECYEMYTTAKYVHELEHHQANRERIKRMAGDLDEQFHHIEEHLDSWIDDHDFHGAHGQGQIATQLRRLETTLHHFMTDVGVRRKPRPEPPSGDSSLPPPPVGQ